MFLGFAKVWEAIWSTGGASFYIPTFARAKESEVVYKYEGKNMKGQILIEWLVASTQPKQEEHKTATNTESGMIQLKESSISRTPLSELYKRSMEASSTSLKTQEELIHYFKGSSTATHRSLFLQKIATRTKNSRTCSLRTVWFMNQKIIHCLLLIFQQAKALAFNGTMALFNILPF